MGINFAKDLANKLNSDVTSLTLGSNLFHSVKLSDDTTFPDQMVAIYPTYSGSAKRCFGNAKEIRYVKAMILVRSNTNSFESTFDLTEEIWETLQTSNLSPYKDIKFSSSGFEEQNEDESNRYIFKCEIEGWYVRTP